MDALVKGAVKALEPMAFSRQQQLTVYVGQGPALYADLGRLDQVLVNLLSNAVKFTPEGGIITIEARFDEFEQLWRIVVADNGVGIPADEQARLFEQFYRAATSAYGVSGTGLGLAISKAVVELHGGTISIESTPGEGTTATVELPAGSAEPDPTGA